MKIKPLIGRRIRIGRRLHEKAKRLIDLHQRTGFEFAYFCCVNLHTQQSNHICFYATELLSPFSYSDLKEQAQGPHV